MSAMAFEARFLPACRPFRPKAQAELSTLIALPGRSQRYRSVFALRRQFRLMSLQTLEDFSAPLLNIRAESLDIRRAGLPHGLARRIDFRTDCVARLRGSAALFGRICGLSHCRSHTEKNSREGDSASEHKISCLKDPAKRAGVEPTHDTSKSYANNSRVAPI